MQNTDTQINIIELDQYSKALSKKLVDYFFIDHSYIEGKEILQFSDIRQINLMILKKLFDRWQTETARLRSPYFDYEHPEAIKAMQAFVNVLSHHIRVHKNDFAPLVSEAVSESLLLVLDPSYFFGKEFNRADKKVWSLAYLKEQLKYIFFNRSLYKSFVEKLDNNNLEELTSKEAAGVFDEIFRQNQYMVEPMTANVQAFSDILPLDLDKLFGQSSTPEVTFELDPKPQKLESEDPVPLMLNDLLAPTNEQPLTLLDKFSEAKIDNIRNAISVNQKFQYINKLFMGNSLVFNEALDKLEECSLHQEALLYIQQEFAEKFAWDAASDDVKSFYELLERRFL